MFFPDSYLYTKRHQWLDVKGNIAKIGLTVYAEHRLGDITFIDLPQPGSQVEKDAALFHIESIKTAVEIISPVSGTIIEVNATLREDPGQINLKPFETWIVTVELRDRSEMGSLMRVEEYEEFCSSLE